MKSTGDTRVPDKQREIEQNRKVRGLQKADKRKKNKHPEMRQTGKKYLYSLMNGAIKNRIVAQRGGRVVAGCSEDRKGAVRQNRKRERSE